MAIQGKWGIEIPTLLSFFAVMLSAPVNTNFVIYRTCYVILGYNETLCAKLGTDQKDNATDALEKLVEPEANVIRMTTGMLGQILPALTCLFVGSWSDKHGRRPILIISMLGFLGSMIIQVIVSLIPNASPWHLLYQSIPSTLTGSLTTFIMISLCYVTETTSIKNRGIRIGIFEAMVALGTLLGTASSSYIFNATGYTTVFTISMLLVALACLHIYFFVEESIVITEEARKYTNPFSISGVKEVIMTVVKRRQNHKRPILLLLMTTLVLYILVQNNSNILYPFFRVKFHWSMRKFTLYSSVNIMVCIVGAFVGIYVCNRLLRVSELFLLFVSFVSLSMGSIIFVVANSDGLIYAGAAIQSISNVVSPMIRSLISKIIDPSDTGKVFALLLSIEAFAFILGNLIYTLIYNATIDTFPSAFYLLSGGVYTILIVFIVAIVLLRRQQGEDYNTLTEDT